MPCLRIAAVAFFVGLCSLLTIGTRQASAATGGAYTVVTLSCNGKAYADLDVGDIVTVSITNETSATLTGSQLVDTEASTTPISNVFHLRYQPHTPLQTTYHLTAKPTSGTLWVVVGPFGTSAAVTCASGGGSSGSNSGNNSNSTLHPLQTDITPVVANTSGQIIAGAIENGIFNGFSAGGSGPSFGPAGAFVSVGDEPKTKFATRAGEAFSAIDNATNMRRTSLPARDPGQALAYAGPIANAPVRKPLPLERIWSAWADFRATGWKINDTSGSGNDVNGGQFNFTAGLGRKLNPDTLVGLMTGFEYFKYDVASLNGSLKGDGETVGSYFSRRFAGSLRFDMALAWTYLNYSAKTSTANGSFKAYRWLTTLGLTGIYRYKNFAIEPSAKVFALWETDKAWTDSLGTAQAARKFSAGRTALGAQVSRSFAVSHGWTIAPHVGLYGDWQFQTDDAIATSAVVANIGGGWSGRVTAGVSASGADGKVVTVNSEYGGLGANYKIWSGNVRLTVPL